MKILRQSLSVAKCCCKKNNHYAMGGALVERRNGVSRAVSTNGKILVVTEWETPGEKSQPDFRVILSESTCKKATRLAAPVKKVRDKGLGSKLNFVNVKEPDANGLVTISGEYAAKSEDIVGQELDGRFPNYVAAFSPLDTSHRHVSLNACLLSDLLRAVADAGGCTKDDDRVIVTFGDSTSPVTISRVSADGVKVAGIIMPDVGEMQALETERQSTLAKRTWQPKGENN